MERDSVERKSSERENAEREIRKEMKLGGMERKRGECMSRKENETPVLKSKGLP